MELVVILGVHRSGTSLVVGLSCVKSIHPAGLAITHKWNLVQSLLQAGYLRGGASPSI